MRLKMLFNLLLDLAVIEGSPDEVQEGLNYFFFEAETPMVSFTLYKNNFNT